MGTPIAIHDNSLRIVDYIDNNVPGSLKISNETFTRYLATGAYTYDFTVKKNQNEAIWDRLKYLNDQASLSFRYKGRDYLCTITKYTEDDDKIQIESESLNLGILNATVLEYEADQKYSFEEYLNIFGLFRTEHVVVEYNEIESDQRQEKFSNSQSSLARVLELAKRFSAEIDFVSKINPDGTFNSLSLRIYRTRTNDHMERGIGRLRKDIHLRTDVDLKNVKKKVDKTKLFTALRIKDKEGNFIKFKKSRKIKGADGLTAVYVTRNSDTVYAPKGMLLYPSTTKKNACDRWIVKEVKTEYVRENEQDEDMIWAYASGELSNSMYPGLTFDAEVDPKKVRDTYNIDIGDTIYITDTNFYGTLHISARIKSIAESLQDNSTYKLTLDNYQQVVSQVPISLTQRMTELAQEAQPYRIVLTTDNAISFKGDSGRTNVTAQLFKGQDEVTKDVTWRYAMNGKYLSEVASTLQVSPSSFEGDTGLLQAEAYVNGQQVASDQMSFSVIRDGADGKIGKDGKPGRGVDSLTTYYILATSSQPPTHELANGWTTKLGFVTKEYPYAFRFVRTNFSDSTYHDTDTELVAYRSNGANDLIVEQQGINGKNGIPLDATANPDYLHVVFADDNNGTNPSQEANGKFFIGLKLSKNAIEDSGWSGYTWNRVVDTGPAIYNVDSSKIQVVFSDDMNTIETDVKNADDKLFIGFKKDAGNYYWFPTKNNMEYSDVNRARWTGEERLIPKSASPDWLSNPGWTPFGRDGQVQISTPGDAPIITHPTTIKIFEPNCGFYQAGYPAKKGWYTLSAWVKAPAGVKIKMSIFGSEFPSPAHRLEHICNGQWEWLSKTTYLSDVGNKTKTGISQFEIVAFNNSGEGPLYVCGVLFRRSSVENKIWSPSPMDLESGIASKVSFNDYSSDKEDTSSKLLSIQKDIQAKADLTAIDSITKQLMDLSNNAARIDNNNKELLNQMGNRLVGIVEDLKGLQYRWEDVDRYVSFANEGMVIGSKDGRNKLYANEQGIYLESNGLTGLKLQNGMVTVDNGAFIASLRIGQYITEPLMHATEDINVIRYIGTKKNR